MVKDERPRPGFEEMARALHASYLDRWSRHDPAGLDRLAAIEAERRRQEPAGKEKSSAA